MDVREEWGPRERNPATGQVNDSTVVPCKGRNRDHVRSVEVLEVVQLLSGTLDVPHLPPKQSRDR